MFTGRKKFGMRLDPSDWTNDELMEKFQRVGRVITGSV